MLDLIFTTEQRESGPMVTGLVSVPLSWSHHHLIKWSLTVALLPCGEQGPIEMIHHHRLLDLIGFQDTMQGIPAELVGIPANALVDSSYATATRAVDTITLECPLHC